MGQREEKICLDFIAAYRDSWPKDMAKACEPLAEDAYYQIVVPTTPPVKGRANIVAEHLLMQKTSTDQKHKMISYGSGPNGVVYTERVDSSMRNGKWTEVPLVAVFEVNAEGKISAWREYLDLAHCAKSHGMTVESLLATVTLPKHT